MRAKTKGKHEMRKRFAILIGAAAVGVMALGAQTVIGADGGTGGAGAAGERGHDRVGDRVGGCCD